MAPTRVASRIKYGPSHPYPLCVGYGMKPTFGEGQAVNFVVYIVTSVSDGSMVCEFHGG